MTPTVPPTAGKALLWLLLTIAVLGVGVGISFVLFVIASFPRGDFSRLSEGTKAIVALPALVGVLAAYFTGRRFLRSAPLIKPRHVLVVAGGIAAVVALGKGIYAWEAGTRASRPTPQRVVGQLTFRSIASGGSDTCALSTEGVPYCWGESYGREPRPIAADLRLISLVSDRRRTCGLNAEGATYCFAPSLTQAGSPVTAQELLQPDAPVLASLSAGELGLCGLTADGTAYCDRSVGAETLYMRGACDVQSPDGICEDGSGPNDEVMLDDGVAVDFRAVGGNRRFLELAVGDRLICARVQGGETLCWGSPGLEMDGRSVVNLSRPPRRLGAGLSFTRLSVSGSTTCALDADGAAWCIGGLERNRDASVIPMRAVGGPSSNSDGVAVDAPSAARPRFEQVSAGGDRSCAIAADRTAYCWENEIPYSESDPRYGEFEPRVVEGGQRFVQLTTGYRHACGLSADGAAWCWGDNDRRQLGRHQWPW